MVAGLRSFIPPGSLCHPSGTQRAGGDVPITTIPSCTPHKPLGSRRQQPSKPTHCQLVGRRSAPSWRSSHHTPTRGMSKRTRTLLQTFSALSHLAPPPSVTTTIRSTRHEVPKKEIKVAQRAISIDTLTHGATQCRRWRSQPHCSH